MSNNDDDEFNDVVKGLPADNTAQKSSIKFVLIFLISGVILAVVILQFGGRVRFSQENFIPPQMMMNGAVSLLIGSLQAWIFKAKIKSRLLVFISFSLLGGLIGGLIGGALINSGIKAPIIIGATNGVLAGGLSSLAQNRLMGNKKYSAKWFFYNAISWAVIYAIAWTISWRANTDLLTFALTAGFLIVASGVSLVLFLRRTPQIEFS